MRVEQNTDVGPFRTPENNVFWRRTTTKLPVPSLDSLPCNRHPIGLHETRAGRPTIQRVACLCALLGTL